MRPLLIAGGLAIVVSLGLVPEASAFTRHGPGSDITSDAGGAPGHGIGAWRRHYDRQQYQRYRGHPGAQYELRQKRRNLCRNTPEMC